MDEFFDPLNRYLCVEEIIKDKFIKLKLKNNG